SGRPGRGDEARQEESGRPDPVRAPPLDRPGRADRSARGDDPRGPRRTGRIGGGVSVDGDGALLDLIRLTLVPGVGPRTCRSLLERFGSARNALDAPESALRDVPGIG